jgi:hypothetical protein
MKCNATKRYDATKWLLPGPAGADRRHGLMIAAVVSTKEEWLEKALVTGHDNTEVHSTPIGK